VSVTRNGTDSRGLGQSFRSPAAVVIPPRSALRAQPVSTPRMLLGPVEPSDAPDLWEAIEASRWYLERWLPWVPFTNTLQAVDRYAEACIADWDAGRALRCALRDRESGSLLGVVGLDSCVHLHRACELGYWLRHDVTGRGLMTEAARAMVEFAFSRLGMHRVRCAAATDNYPSLRVISRLEFKFEGTARHAEFVGARWVDHAVFSRLSTD
jgi:ribosomal-protein-serine acetyltransferase